MTTGSQFVEPGAKNNRGEFKHWVHVKIEGTRNAPMLYPYPFDKSWIDTDLILAHYLMTRLVNWPGMWPVFRKDIVYFAAHYKPVWRLSNYIHDVEGERFEYIPKELIDALTRPEKAGGEPV